MAADCGAVKNPRQRGSGKGEKNVSMTRTGTISAEAAFKLLARLEAERGREKILVCSPQIAGRLIRKFEAESLEELDGRLGVGVLPLAFVADDSVSIVEKATIEKYMNGCLDEATRRRLGIKEPETAEKYFF